MSNCPACGYEIDTQAAEPTRSQKMRAAGFTARDKRLTCDECGAKFTAQFAPLHECASQAARAQPQEPPRSAPLTEDPHGEHWAAIAKAAEAIGASANCGPEQADQFCQAIDRLSAALMDEREPLTPDQIWANDEIMAENAHAGLLMMNLERLVRAIERAHGIK